MTASMLTEADLQTHGEFVRRHVGPSEDEIALMLRAVGATSLEEMTAKTVPAAIRASRPLRLPPALSEQATLDALAAMAAKNEVRTSLIGMGYHGTLLPGVILRNVLENPGWYTAYTPYQAEVSQGRLEALLNYQQMVIDLTAMEIANASLLDEGTAAAEAMTMAHRVGKSKSERFFVDADTHPQTVAVLRTRAEPMGIEVVVGDPARDLAGQEFFATLLSYPGSSGAVRDLRPAIAAVHAKGGLAIVASDLLALVMLTPPGEMGADIVVGSAQRFGVPMGYGGPHAAFFATKDAYKRSMPGRIIGVSVDARGKPALRMALQTREQHIRRDKATSNICTAQVLLAVIAGMYAIYHGPEGLKAIATRVHRLTGLLAAALKRAGLGLGAESFFDTLTVRVPGRASAVLAAAAADGINLRLVDADLVGLSLDETSDLALAAQVAGHLTGKPHTSEQLLAGQDAAAGRLGGLARSSAYLTHPVFAAHRSETAMLRYLRKLQGKDVALDRAMIPLGSCTMKLNATTEMIPVTWPGFGALHPFAPVAQAAGYAELFQSLEAWLCEITGFAAVSLQPNAGSQGEYAGLLVIRAYHAARGEAHRKICLIPSSAHGTNPASAVMAGMQVVVVGDDHGNVDVADLRAKALKHAHELAALMITYPSTHGVFEESIKEICAIVHEHGGQVYMDGANLNALVGLVRPAELGADVSHMNLHKTFCIPHGGGGPGMGPIGVAAHLAPYLPGHPVVALHGDNAPVSAAPWGSASILPISWAYIAMMGGPGLTKATQVAILVANYVARRLEAYYPIVYTGQNGMVAHECIVDLRGIKARTGITAEDVAKRLVDYGFHAPTMSWPVPETMMIEPTESESLQELDRFCDAMIAISAEIRAIEEGKADKEDNVLKHAPHTADLLLGDWKRPYGKAQAFFPVASLHDDKYWPPVARVDNVYGDRNLVCSCPPVEAYAKAAE